MGSIKKIKNSNVALNPVTTSGGTHESVQSFYANKSDNPEVEIYKNDNMFTTKVVNNSPGAIVGAGFNSAAFTVLPQRYAARTGQDVTNITNVLPDFVNVEKISGTQVGKKALDIADGAYMENVRGINQFYNKGNFVIEEGFGEEAFSSLAERTGATVASPKNILKVATNKVNLAFALFGGVMDARETFLHYSDIGGVDEAAKHKGEIGGRFVGSTTGNVLGFVAGTGITALISGAATGAVVGGTAGSVVPVLGTVVGVVGGAVVGAVASTFLGDLCADIGANLFDGG